jgi:hypothetical protein
MMGMSATKVIKMVALLQALMKHATGMTKPDVVDSYITTPEQNKTDYHIVVLKAAFLKKEDADKFLEFDAKLDKAIGDL